MDEQERSARRMTFDESADAYDSIRPGYPAHLVQILLARAGLSSSSNVLEIGCGSGQLTRDLAPTGCEIVCLEPSRELARLAARNLAVFPRVQVREETFEQFDVADGSVDLVVAATSFHWIDPAVRCSKSSRALRSGGTLAILTNTHPGPWVGFFERVQDVYRAIAPELARSGSTERLSDEHADELARSGLFDAVEMFSHRWERRLARDQYLTLLDTFSPHRRLPAERRMLLFCAIGTLIDQEYGGFVDQPGLSTLCLARKVQ
jgi:SAM-dependent methyltransferase